MRVSFRNHLVIRQQEFDVAANVTRRHITQVEVVIRPEIVRSLLAHI